MRQCTQTCVYACLVASVVHAHSGLKRFRSLQGGHPTSSASPVAQSLWATLHEFKWTMFLGDSVLGAQFLTVAHELGATPDEPGLVEHDKCTEQGGAWPTFKAVQKLMDKPAEYLLLCGPTGCEFSRLGCMNFYASVCVDKDHCSKACEGTQVWDGMIQRITQAISQTGYFAVSFHWAPSYFPHTNVYDRLSHFVPGALLWNNCHHWIGHGQAVAEPAKLDTWLSYVDASATVLEKFVGLQSLAYQGCTRTLCEGGVRDEEDHSPEWVEQCQGRKKWLEKANSAAQKVIEGRGMKFVNLQALLPDDVLRVAFLDGSHPCFPIPCMWQSSQVHPPRQCCQSLVMHSFQSLGGLPDAGSNSWDVPSLVNASGMRNNGNHSLLKDSMAMWDEARPEDSSHLKAMI